jgi:hypothetical protein
MGNRPQALTCIGDGLHIVVRSLPFEWRRKCRLNAVAEFANVRQRLFNGYSTTSPHQL